MQTSHVPEIDEAAEHVVSLALTRIRQVIEPEQVWLFGSWARGEAGPDSDLDLLVVANEAQPRVDVTRRLLRRLANLPVPKDVVVLSPAEWESMRSVPGTIAFPAAHEGRLIYERART